ncbi:band-7-like membrane protein [Streptomyces phage EGole]|uniref:Band-7-like membrane protein n=1 Tax=Streptomyces phage EGole TaxID=2517973 RepID=A0A482JH87_9CAUD|nr:band-7-like membrane protein [Streptomyces phage EGole]QBP30922.1 band-7-like membrane protein [Streptomyces phage EGole]
MTYLVIAGLLLLVLLVAVAFSAVTKQKGGYLVAVGVGLLLAVFTLFNSVTSVGARNVGIQTAFGRYQGNLDNGLQVIAPWSEHEDFSTQVQYLDLDGEKWDEGATVTFDGGGRGVVYATPRWRINEGMAGELWKKYKNFDNVRDQLVKSSAKDSFRAVLTEYTPNDARTKVREVAAKVQSDLASSLKDDGIIIDSISIKDIKLDDRTQSSLDKIVQANNDIERSKSEQERAKIDAETAKIREKTGALKPEALQRYCLEVVNNWDVKKNGNLPAGFNCNGSNVPFTVTNK